MVWPTPRGRVKAQRSQGPSATTCAGQVGLTTAGSRLVLLVVRLRTLLASVQVFGSRRRRWRHPVMPVIVVSRLGIDSTVTCWWLTWPGVQAPPRAHGRLVRRHASDTPEVCLHRVRPVRPPRHRHRHRHRHPPTLLLLLRLELPGGLGFLPLRARTPGPRAPGAAALFEWAGTGQRPVGPRAARGRGSTRPVVWSVDQGLWPWALCSQAPPTPRIPGTTALLSLRFPACLCPSTLVPKSRHLGNTGEQRPACMYTVLYTTLSVQNYKSF